MYVCLGQDRACRTDEIIAVFDLDSATVSKRTREYLAAAQKNNEVMSLTSGLPAGFALTAPEGDRTGQTVYILQISAQTLARRCEEKSIY